MRTLLHKSNVSSILKVLDFRKFKSQGHQTAAARLLSKALNPVRKFIKCKHLLFQGLLSKNRRNNNNNMKNPKNPKCLTEV